MDLIENSSNNIGFRNIAIKDIISADGWLFITLENDQKILTNGECVYDFSEYDHLKDIFIVGNRTLASFIKGFSSCLVDIETREVLFNDSNAYHISMENERVLHVIRHRGNNTIYDLVTKKYLPVPDNYEFESALNDNLYVFREEDNSKKFYDLKRCVISADGNVLMQDVTGYIQLIDNYLLISKNDELIIYEMNVNGVTYIKTLKKGEELIAKPSVYKDFIIVILKGLVKLIKPNLEVVREYKIDGLEEVLDTEWVGDTLKFCLPYIKDGEKINKQMHLNLKTGKIITHTRIDGYPYWTPTTYVGRDEVNDISDLGIDFHFYDAHSNPFLNINARLYEAIGNGEQIFFFFFSNGKNYLLNSETKVVQEIPYDDVCFHPSNPYGFGVNKKSGTIDFIDKNFNVLVAGINYKKYKLNLTLGGFGYFIVNGYLRLSIPFEDGYGQERYRCVLIGPNREVLIDSINDKCFSLSEFIQIVSNRKVEFLDTRTGKKGVLGIKAPVDDDGTIDFARIGNMASAFTILNDVKGIESPIMRERKLDFEDTED